GWGATTLTRENTVGALIVAGGLGAVQFTDARNLDLQGISAVGQTVTLTAGTGGPFTLGESAGVINAGTLSLSGWGATTLTRENTVGTLSVAGGSGAVQGTDARKLDLQGIGAAGQTVTSSAG